MLCSVIVFYFAPVLVVFCNANLDNIQEYLENCETAVGNKITEAVSQLNQAGIQKEVQVQCENEECGHVFPSALEFDPVNFSTAS